MKNWIIATLFAATAGTAFAAGETITVYKDKNCGCCEGWIAHLRESGFKVKAVNSDDMAAVKKRLGIPEQMRSCHTAVLDKSGQIIEGHVPAGAINKLLVKPGTKGIAAPGMGKLNGTLVTFDFAGKPFSKD